MSVAPLTEEDRVGLHCSQRAVEGFALAQADGQALDATAALQYMTDYTGHWPSKGFLMIGLLCTLGIVGESGSGTSTLMDIIGALDKPTQGSYWLAGVDVEQAPDRELSAIRNKKIGFVFQTYNLIGRQSALKNVELPMLYAGVQPRQRTRRAHELLAMVEIGDG